MLATAHICYDKGLSLAMMHNHISSSKIWKVCISSSHTGQQIKEQRKHVLSMSVNVHTECAGNVDIPVLSTSHPEL